MWNKYSIQTLIVGLGSLFELETTRYSINRDTILVSNGNFLVSLKFFQRRILKYINCFFTIFKFFLTIEQNKIPMSRHDNGTGWALSLQSLTPISQHIIILILVFPYRTDQNLLSHPCSRRISNILVPDLDL